MTNIFSCKGGETMKTTEPKQAIPVKVIYSPEGIATPIAFQWVDDEWYDINHVLERKPGRSLKHGALGMLYKCKVNRSVIYLVEEHGRWFLDRADEHQAAINVSNKAMENYR